MKLTDFSSTVKIFKKNFSLKKAKYKLAKRQVLAKRRKEREDRIEQQNAVKPLIKGAKGKVPGSNFFDNIKRFLGFTLAGLILSNLDTIISTLKDVFKKIKEIVENISDFVDGVIGGLQSFFDGLDGAKKRMEDLLSPILNADLSSFVPFQNELDKVLTGVLGIAALITGLYQGGKGADGNGGSTLIDETAKGSAVGVNIAAQRKAARIKALNEAKKLRAQKAAARAAAREAAEKAAKEAAEKAAEKAAKEAAERVKKVQKVFGQQTPAGVRTSGGSGTVYSRGVINPSDKNFAAIIKNELKKLNNKKLSDMLFFDDPKIDPQTRNIVKEIIDERLKKQVYFTPDDLKTKDLTRSIFDENTPKVKINKLLKSATPEVPSATPSPDKVSKFNQIMKNARGFIKPKNLKLLRGFAKDLGIGLAIEFAAGWAIDRGLEAIGLDEKSLLEKRVLKFNKLPKEKQKSIIERLNSELEKELEYQKTFFAKVEKVIALGDMTVNERKIKSLTSFLTAVSISGAGPVYDLVSAGPLPDYLGSEVDTTLPSQLSTQPSTPKISTPSIQPSTPKISIPSVMPPLPPTGTLGTGAQAYGAPRAGGARKHAGVDFDPADDKNSKFYSRIGGEVIYAQDSGDPGYGNVVDIYNAELGFTERIAEGNKIHVKKGDIVKPGTLVQSGSEMTGVFHYEIRKGKAGASGAFEGTVNPLKFLENLQKTQDVKQSPQASIKTSSSNLISSAGLDQSTSYSTGGTVTNREVVNYVLPIKIRS